MKNYRIASWWFRWDDLAYPDEGIKEKMYRRAAAFSEAGIEIAFIFGFHCRWDYVYCFDRVHELIKLSCEACHEHGIKVFDHFSTTLTHRPRSMDGEWKLYAEGRNRMTFHPSAEMAQVLTWRGSLLNDWRMRRIRDDKVVFVEQYQAEIFCMNNPEFRKASADYLKKLHSKTGIDGILFDDGVFFAGWDSCGCSHCRKLFKERSGQDLPEYSDTSFWGNYANPYFREWVRFRYDTTVEFLKIPKNVLGADFPVSACCNDSSTKSKDATGINIYYFTEAIDYIELEMCGDISNTELAARVPGLFLSRAASIRKDFSCFGLGFAFYPDTAFLIWALNKLFGLGCWISAGKGRVNIATSEMNDLPNEEDIIGEAYNYEKNNPELFEGSPDSSVAVFFSSNTKINYGDSKADYENTYNNLVKACFETNLPIDVILNLEEIKNHSLLVLADVACLGKSEIEILKDFLKSGGTIIASGLLGLLDENGNKLENNFLKSFGLNCKLPEVTRPIDRKKLFASVGKWMKQAREIPDKVEVLTGIKKNGDFYNFQLEKGQLFWSPYRLNNSNAVPCFIEQLRRLVKTNYHVKAPEGLKWQAFCRGNETIIHFLNTHFSTISHPVYRYLDEPIGTALSYKSLQGELSIHGDFKHAELFSPDLTVTRHAKNENGIIRFELEGIQRFCSIKLY